MMQGLAGWQSLTGEPDGPPTKSGLSLVDLSGGYASAIALLAGIWRARRDGVGCDCDVSLFETALHELMYVGTVGGHEGLRAAAAARTRRTRRSCRSRTSSRRRLDRRRRPRSRSSGSALCDVIGRPELSEDERFATMAGAERQPRRAAADAGGRSSARAPADEWIDALVAAGVPASRVNTVAGGARRPADGRARGHRRVRAPDARDRADDSHAPPARVRRRAQREPERGPFRGEHTGAVLVELCGYAPERVEELADDGRLRRHQGEQAGTSSATAQQPPDAAWPGGARLAISFVLNYEEGGENTPLDGDPASEAFLHEIVGAPPTVGRAQPEHRVDVRVRQPRRLLARAPPLHGTGCR